MSDCDAVIIGGGPAGLTAGLYRIVVYARNEGSSRTSGNPFTIMDFVVE